ncbi:MAG: AAA family ATPase [Ignavibacteria bacterium]|nr:AAA family ATPase [Ignavibacteria bacterium]
MGIHSVKIQNYKSIRESGEILMKPLNVLIGPNGAGKSNFISFFEFLNKLYEKKLQLYIAEKNRADNFSILGKRSNFYPTNNI